MICTGFVSDDLEALIPLELASPQNVPIPIMAVIDTGFNGYLTLPSDHIASLELPFHSFAEAQLGDGQTVALRKFEGNVLWNNELRPLTVLETQGAPLVGMAFLINHRVTLEVRVGGLIAIDSLNSSD